MFRLCAADNLLYALSVYSLTLAMAVPQSTKSLKFRSAIFSSRKKSMLYKSVSELPSLRTSCRHAHFWLLLCTRLTCHNECNKYAMVVVSLERDLPQPFSQIFLRVPE